MPLETQPVGWSHRLGAAGGADRRRIRALIPWPGAFTTFGAETLKLLDAEVVASPPGPPGIVLDDRLTVSCGESALRILRLQRAGRAPAAADAFLRGFAILAGTRLGPE